MTDLILKPILVLALTAFTCLAYAQRTPGVVSIDGKPLTGASVKDLKTRAVVLSDKEGHFAAKFNIGDSILTSYVGLKTDTLIFKGQHALNIKLVPASSVLSEVVIRNYKMSPLENFKNKQEEYKQIYRKGNNKIITGVGFGIAISIDGIYSALSKEGKDARRMQRTLVRDYESSVVDSRFTKSLVAETTGYQGKQLDSFYFDNRPTYQFIKGASDYDIIQYIQQKKKEYILPKDSSSVMQIR